jgi:hypothetical protein
MSLQVVGMYSLPDEKKMRYTKIEMVAGSYQAERPYLFFIYTLTIGGGLSLDMTDRLFFFV